MKPSKNLAEYFLTLNLPIYIR